MNQWYDCVPLRGHNSLSSKRLRGEKSFFIMVTTTSISRQMRARQSQSVNGSRGAVPHLSTEQRELLKSVLSHKTPDDCFAPDHRLTIRKIASSCETIDRPEQVLIAFKNSLDDAANNLRIPFSPERNTLLTGLVTAFIEEMYSSAPVTRDSACQGQ
jgi:hypothetical protein